MVWGRKHNLSFMEFLSGARHFLGVAKEAWMCLLMNWGMEEHHFRGAAWGGILRAGHTGTGSSSAALGVWMGDLQFLMLSSAQAAGLQQCPFWICDFVLVRAGLILISFSWV